MKNIKPDLLCSSITLALLLCAGNAVADVDEEAGAPPASGNATVHSLDQITVTARGVSEPLQQMPLPITAMSEQIIEKKGLTDARDIATLSPSFSFKSAYGRGFDRPVIRGMSNIQGEANASFFIDGVYVEGDISSYGLENIQRVEVIRGPQVGRVRPPHLLRRGQLHHQAPGQCAGWQTHPGCRQLRPGKAGPVLFRWQ
ncbi:Plug domain-containing protein [Paracoccus sp. (in: a-proteobacteria)]|uniref:Plug domain-containing protein n=1 Tax=Paracoccus sp. TaxID=267 RepID=UPI002AFFFCF9|nr:Plug domain-containing protein [Paracoccus sp. (in: a-proteobacteria)]